MRMVAPASRLHPPVGLMCIGPGEDACRAISGPEAAAADGRCPVHADRIPAGDGGNDGVEGHGPPPLRFAAAVMGPGQIVPGPFFPKAMLPANHAIREQANRRRLHGRHASSLAVNSGDSVPVPLAGTARCLSGSAPAGIRGLPACDHQVLSAHPAAIAGQQPLAIRRWLRFPECPHRGHMGENS